MRHGPQFIGVDFDETVVRHEYPDVGSLVPLAIETLRELVDAGHRLILWTMRSDKELEDAIAIFKENKIRLFGVNANPTQKSWTNSPKAYCNLYIDDAALGCPLLFPGVSSRPYVDWRRVREILVDSEFLPRSAEVVK